MSLPAQKVKRTPLHTRAITIQVFEREDDLWDLEATLIDTKAYAFPLSNGGEHPAGQPIHHMVLSISINADYQIVDAGVQYRAAPYKVCPAIADNYKKLIGLNLIRGFRRDLKTHLSATNGCTHVSELAQFLPTAAIQGVAARLNRFNAKKSTTRPFHIDGCHALSASGPVVKEHYPQWYEKPATRP